MKITVPISLWDRGDRTKDAIGVRHGDFVLGRKDNMQVKIVKDPANYLNLAN
ncbi:hypothetical protein [Devriesea agamarum]|uniref:hypothetical protein n=1 Tax=Devriesea agamarum TaxID=472569 RepID=UPI0012ECE6BF|nr:hypothetical protein [Devriesea agamarum]